MGAQVASMDTYYGPGCEMVQKAKACRTSIGRTRYRARAYMHFCAALRFVDAKEIRGQGARLHIALIRQHALPDEGGADMTNRTCDCLCGSERSCS
jgi:hypothetical protein